MSARMPGYIKPEVFPISTPAPTVQRSNAQVTYPGGYGVQPRDSTTNTNRPIINPHTGRPKSPDPDPDPSGIDEESTKKHFGWTTIENINVPILFRTDEKYTSVRIVESKFLNRFPSTFSDELGNQSPLISYYVTPAEAKLLNEINQYHCNGEYGKEEFTQNDLIVKVSEFIDFLNLVKQTFPEEVIESRKLGIPLPKPSELRNSLCGWIQVNNTISPYIRREGKKYVISNVMRHAAQLPLTSQHKEYLPTDPECQRINKLCQSAGFDFQFGQSTKFISLDMMRSEHHLKVVELPQHNPRDYAKYTDNNNSIDKSVTITRSQPFTQAAPQPRRQLQTTRSGHIRPSGVKQPHVPYNHINHTPSNSSQVQQPLQTPFALNRQVPTTIPNAPSNQSNIPNHSLRQLIPANYLPPQQVVQYPSNMIPNMQPQQPSSNLTNSYSYMNSHFNAFNQHIVTTAAQKSYSVSNVTNSRPHMMHTSTSSAIGHINGPPSASQLIRMKLLNNESLTNKHNRQVSDVRVPVSPTNRLSHMPMHHNLPGILRHGQTPNTASMPRAMLHTAPGSQPIATPYYSPTQIVSGQFFPMIPGVPISTAQISPRNSNIPNVRTPYNNVNMWNFNGANNSSAIPSLPTQYSAQNSMAMNGISQAVSATSPRFVNTQESSISSPSYHNILEQSANNQYRLPVSTTGNSVTPHAQLLNKYTGHTDSISYQKMSSYSNCNQKVHTTKSSQNKCHQPQLNINSTISQTIVNALQGSPPALIADYTIQTKNILARDYHSFVANSQTDLHPLFKDTNPVAMPTAESPPSRSSRSTEALTPDTIQNQVMNTQVAETEISPPPLIPVDSVSISSSTTSIDDSRSKITSHTFEGKGISCVSHTPNEPYALLEAVQKLYFKDTRLDEFEFVIQQVLDVTTTPCTATEERAFVEYYELPTPILNSNKLIKLSDLATHFQRLTFMFKDKKREDDASSVSSTYTTPSPSNIEDQSVPNDGDNDVRIVCDSDTEDSEEPANKRQRLHDYSDDVIIIE